MLARDRPEEHPGVSEAELAHIRAGLPVPSTGVVPPTPWGAILTDRNVWGLFVSYFCFGYVAWLFFSWFFIYLAEARHVDLKASALYSMMPFIAMTICCLTGGVANDRIAKKYGLFWGRAGLAVVAFILTAGFLAAGSQVTSTRAGRSDPGGRRRCAVSVAEFVLVGHRGYRRAVYRRRVGLHEHGVPDRRRDHGIADAMDRGGIWLDRSLRHSRHPGGRRGGRLVFREA